MSTLATTVPSSLLTTNVLVDDNGAITTSPSTTWNPMITTDGSENVTIPLQDDESIQQLISQSFESTLKHNCSDYDEETISLMYRLSTQRSFYSNTTNPTNITGNGREWIMNGSSSINHLHTNDIVTNNEFFIKNYPSLFHKIINQTLSSDSNRSFCPSLWDGLSCWHRAMPGQQAIIPCFSQLSGIKYDTSRNATRLCLANGSWAERADYNQCVPLLIPTQIPNENLPTTTIYYLGYILSLLALSIALIIFAYFKDLRCTRNMIHTNLMITYLLIAICWITTDRLHANPSQTSQTASCITVIILTYLMATNFSWMFVEGLYLYILVVKTFSIESVNITIYLVIGWCSPAVITIFWSLMKHYFSNNDSELFQCPYQAQDEFDYIYKVPILLVLIVNIFFLGKIMWVLIIKLRASNSMESKQRRKAAKALLVLIPLLGVGYMLVLVTPTHPTAKVVFQYLQAILVSTQGFTVAVLYCFCNGEVRNSLRNQYQRLRLRYGGEYPATHKSTYYRTAASSYYNNNHHHTHQHNHHHHHSYQFNHRGRGRGGGGGGGGDQIRNGRIHSTGGIGLGGVSISSTGSTGKKFNFKRSRDSCISNTTTTSCFWPSGCVSAKTSQATTTTTMFDDDNDNNANGLNGRRSRSSIGITSNRKPSATLTNLYGPKNDTNNNNTTTTNGYHSIPTTPEEEDEFQTSIV